MEPDYREANSVPSWKTSLLALQLCSASWGKMDWNFGAPECTSCGLKILINWSSLSSPGWALIEKQSLLRILRDYYFPWMASSINSSAFQGGSCWLAKPCACIIPGKIECCQRILGARGLAGDAVLAEVTGSLPGVPSPYQTPTPIPGWARERQMYIRQAEAFQDLIVEMSAVQQKCNARHLCN